MIIRSFAFRIAANTPFDITRRRSRSRHRFIDNEPTSRYNPTPLPLVASIPPSTTMGCAA